MLAPVRTAAPVDPLISLSEAKAHLRVDYSDEDNYINGLILAAVSYLDGYSGRLGRALTTQTWTQDFPAFADPLRLAVGDLIAVSSVTYYDATNAQQTLATSVYASATDTLGPYIGLKPDKTWPTTYTRPDAVRVTWTAGFGATSASVPPAIKMAAFLLIGHWYANREATGEGMTELPFAVEALLAPFMRNRI
jgi:uncharacterized phiE125 gp8 family phage protein